MDPTILIPATVIALFALLAFFVWVSRRRERTSPVSVRPKPVLDTARRRLFETLHAGLPNHRVLAQVPFSAFLEPRAGGGRTPLSLHDQVADFLICDSQFRVVAVVEISEPQQRSARDTLLRDAALPLMRWSANALPDASEVRETVRDLESLQAMSDQVADTAPAHGDASVAEQDPPRGNRREPHL